SWTETCQADEVYGYDAEGVARRNQAEPRAVEPAHLFVGEGPARAPVERSRPPCGGQAGQPGGDPLPRFGRPRAIALERTDGRASVSRRRRSAASHHALDPARCGPGPPSGDRGRAAPRPDQ